MCLCMCACLHWGFFFGVTLTVVVIPLFWQREVELYGRTHSDDDDDDEEEANLAQPAAMNYEMDATSASTRHPIKGSKVFKVCFP